MFSLKLASLREKLLNLDAHESANAHIDDLLCSYHDASAASVPPKLEKFLPLIKQLYGDSGVGRKGSMEDLIENIDVIMKGGKEDPETVNWLQGQLDAFASSSPTSLKVGHLFRPNVNLIWVI